MWLLYWHSWLIQKRGSLFSLASVLAKNLSSILSTPSLWLSSKLSTRSEAPVWPKRVYLAINWPCPPTPLALSPCPQVKWAWLFPTFLILCHFVVDWKMLRYEVFRLRSWIGDLLLVLPESVDVIRFLDAKMDGSIELENSAFETLTRVLPMHWKHKIAMLLRNLVEQGLEHCCPLVAPLAPFFKRESWIWIPWSPQLAMSPQHLFWGLKELEWKRELDSRHPENPHLQLESGHCVYDTFW